MSRRYGRNQKRRHRAEVAKLQSQAQKLWKIIDNQPEEFARLKLQVMEYEKRVADVLGNRSWLKSCTNVHIERRAHNELDSVLVQLGLVGHKRPHLASSPHARGRSFDNTDRRQVPIDIATDFIEVIAMKSQVVVEQLRKLIHVRLNFKDGRIAYTLTPEQIVQLLGSLQGRKELIKKLSEDIATEMVEHLAANSNSVLREFAKPTYKYEYIHW